MLLCGHPAVKWNGSTKNSDNTGWLRPELHLIMFFGSWVEGTGVTQLSPPLATLFFLSPEE